MNYKRQITLVLSLCFTLFLSACGGGGGSRSDNNEVKVTQVSNSAPVVVVNQSISVDKNKSVDFTLTGTDSDNDALTFTITSQPSNGTLSQSGVTVSYSPAVNFTGTDSFAYKANDGVRDSNVATIEVAVNSIGDDVLIAYNQVAKLELNSHLAIKLTSNANINTLVSYEVITTPQFGRLMGSAPDINYVLNDLTYTGEDSFTYRVNDGSSWSAPATVSILVRDNQVTSAQVGGTDEGLYLHVPNHLVYKDIGPNKFSLEVTRDEDPLDESIRRVQLNNSKLDVDLAEQSLVPPYTVALKWIPDAEANNETIFHSSALAIHQSSGLLTTEVVGATTSLFNHPNMVTTSSCNQATIVVEDNQVTTYLNGAPLAVTTEGAQSLANSLSIGPYQGRVWDLRVYDHALAENDVDDIAQDCSNTTATPFEDLPLYRCGVYMCEWYSDADGLSEEDLATYLYDQDYFYEHNVMAIGMHKHGDIGGYFFAGRPGWETQAKARDLMLDSRWIQYAKLRNRFDNSYWVHEDFHQYQGPLGEYTGYYWAYFMAEATAEWAAVEYSPEVGGLYILGEYIYDSHFPMWMGAYDDQSDYKTIRTDGVNQGGHPYGLYVFFSYLTKEVLSNKVIGDIFNEVDSEEAPVNAIYRLLSNAGVDMRDMFIEFAARTVTYDYKNGLTQAFRDNEANSLASIQNGINPDIHEDSKYVELFDSEGTGEQWQSPPEGKRPGSWGYNLYKVAHAQGKYHLAIEASTSNPEFAEFRAMAILYDAETDTRQYIDIPADELATGIEVFAEGEELILVIATTPSQRFYGFEQYDYQFKMQKLPSKPMYLMAGQSNMEGHIEIDFFDGLLEDLALNSADDLQVRLENRINNWYAFYDGGYADYAASTEVATLQAQELVRLHNNGLVGDVLKQPLPEVLCSFNSPTLMPLKDDCGYTFGPELTLGHYLYANKGQSTSLIKVALGGSTLHTDWLSPTAALDNGTQVGQQFELLSDKIEKLTTKPDSIHPQCNTDACHWSAFIWFQGENDSLSQSGAQSYEENLRTFIHDVRAKVGRENLPVVIVEIGYWAKTLEFGEQVSAAQRKIADEDVNIVLVKTDDLSRYFHYDPAAQMIIGERIGVALKNM